MERRRAIARLKQSNILPGQGPANSRMGGEGVSGGTGILYRSDSDPSRSPVALRSVSGANTPANRPKSNIFNRNNQTLDTTSPLLSTS